MLCYEHDYKREFEYSELDCLPGEATTANLASDLRNVGAPVLIKT